MSLLDERGTGAISWQRNLAVLWCGVFFACASYTMGVPFLPVYLLQELHVESSEVNIWSRIYLLAGRNFAIAGTAFRCAYFDWFNQRICTCIYVAGVFDTA